MHFVHPLRSLLALVVITSAYAATRPTSAAETDISFNRDIRPILADRCLACHGFDAKKRQGDLRLDNFEGATAKIDDHQAIVPGNPDKSEFWKRIITTEAEELMPPPKSKKTLSAAEKQLLKRWIEQGAAYQKHWAFEPPAKAPVPKAETTTENPIDAFLQVRLKQVGLTNSPEASRETLIRRVSFSLTGLPPTLAEIDQYLQDKSPDAYEKMVDRYLASPKFGEEMARHWLDVARYADTHGLHLDNERQTWGYRDYVIKSFNDNKPFDKFTIEQIAGDLLPNATKEQITGTGFLRCNVTTSEGGSIDSEFLYRYAVDRTSTVISTWLGLAGGCCVCHDSKFDPITMRDFYSMYAFFYSNADPAMDGNATLTRPTIRMSSPDQDTQLAAIDAKAAAAQKSLQEQIDKFEYCDPADAKPPKESEKVEAIWLEDDFPAGAKVESTPGKRTQWITAEQGPVHSGKRALKRTADGIGQDFYASGAAPLTVPQNGEFFVYVYLDPQNPPKAVMLQFHKTEWKNRAVWGDYEAIQWGAPNTVERVAAGELPKGEEWHKLTISAEKVGLKPGDSITGFALTQFGGTVYWDKLGITGQINPATDPAHSFAAWRKAQAGKDTPGAPADIAKLIKQGPGKKIGDADAKKLRNYYLEYVCADTKAQLAEFAKPVDALRRERDELEKKLPSTFVFNDLPKPRDAFVMMRGAYDKPGDKVEPATPAVLPVMKQANPERATRLDLANWLVARENPLSARVTVNRFWQQFFGVGLVKSSAEFGSQGELPSHPELFDWLAVTFQDDGWDVKKLVKRMVTSQAFRQASKIPPALLAKDPENRLLARGPRFRLDAEQIRDNALFVGGLLDFTMGGKGVNTYQPPNIWEPVGFVGSNTRFYKQDTGSALYRRSIYTFIKRTAPAPFLVNFDAPNREQSCIRRERSDTPMQALQLMNDVQHFEAARALAERILTEGGASAEDRIRFAYRVILSRTPTAGELAIVGKQLARHQELFAKDEAAAKQAIMHGESKPKIADKPVELAAYTMIANTLLNLDETINRN